MASRGNRHCANCIGRLPFPIALASFRGGYEMFSCTPVYETMRAVSLELFGVDYSLDVLSVTNVASIGTNVRRLGSS